MICPYGMEPNAAGTRSTEIVSPPLLSVIGAVCAVETASAGVVRTSCVTHSSRTHGEAMPEHLSHPRAVRLHAVKVQLMAGRSPHEATSDI